MPAAKVDNGQVIWSLDRIDQPTPNLDAKFSLNGSKAGGGDVTVYVLDTGVNTAHEDFEGRAKLGYGDAVISLGPRV